mgnify:CR=1 FL=1
MQYLMPAEGVAQDRVWMAFPCEGYSLGDTEAARHEARSTWAAVAHAVAQFEPVTMLVDPAELAIAKRYVSQDIEIVEAPLDDAWMRDIGPTFVHAADGSVAAVDWTFNGWGAQDWARWDRDEKIGATVARLAGVPVVDSALVNEGGGIQVDGQGTVLVTETVQLDPGRNPGIAKAAVEAELARTIGQLGSEEDYRVLADRFAVRRSDPAFWQYSDELQATHLKLAPLTAGLLDYNRLENR